MATLHTEPVWTVDGGPPALYDKNGSLCWQNFIHPQNTVLVGFNYLLCSPIVFVYHIYSYVTIVLSYIYHIFTIFLVIISRMISPCWSSGLRDDFVHLHWHQCRKRPLLAPLRWGFRRSGWRAAGAYWDLLALLLGDYMDYIMNHFQKKDLHNIGNRIYLFLFFLGWLYT